MEEDIVYFRHFWEHILMKQMFEIEQRYFARVPLATELYEELMQKFRGGAKCNYVRRPLRDDFLQFEL